MKIEVQNLEITFKILDEIDKSRIPKIIEDTTNLAYELTKKYAKPHIQTGQLEKNIRHKIKNHAGVVWIDDINMIVDWRGKKVNYAVFVLKGTRPHKIEAKRKKALRFYFKSLDEFVYRKSVYHPGYKGDDFLKKAVEETFRRIDKMF